MVEVITQRAWLKADHVKDGDIIEFIDEGEMLEKEFRKGEKKRLLEIGVKVNNEEYKLTMNNTNAERMKKKYGRDSKGWIGKTATINVVSQKVGKVMRDVIYLDEPEEE